MRINQLLLACTIISSFQFAYANKKDTVNAIAFFGFLDNPKLTKIIEDKCNVKF